MAIIRIVDKNNKDQSTSEDPSHIKGFNQRSCEEGTPPQHNLKVLKRKLLLKIIAETV